jgi:hypothetical protein
MILMEGATLICRLGVEFIFPGGCELKTDTTEWESWLIIIQ